MSPEQASGSADVDGRSDVYALGCVTYEMLVGEPPHSGPNAQAIIAKVLTQPVPSVREGRDTVTPAMDAAVHKALARLPADRFATAEQFSGALRQSLDTSISVRGGTRHPARESPVEGSRDRDVRRGAGCGGALGSVAARRNVGPRIRADLSPFRADRAAGGDRSHSRFGGRTLP